MPQGRIQPRTWFVKFGLAVSAERPAPALSAESEHVSGQPTAVPPSDSEIRMCIKNVMDKSNQEGRRIRRLQHVSLSYNPQIQLIQWLVWLVIQRILWTWSDSLMMQCHEMKLQDAIS